MSKVTRPKFVLCIRPGDSEDVEPRKLYQTIPDPKAAKEGYIRIIDESGEDYLHPAEYFAPIKPPLHHPHLRGLQTRRQPQPSRPRRDPPET